jgi:hypothetical protein
MRNIFLFGLLFVISFQEPQSFAQTNSEAADSIILCKGVDIPEGYTVIRETSSADCPKGAYVIKKAAPKIKTDSVVLSEGQKTEVKELMMLIDIMDSNLKRTWNAENDFGVTTDKDKSYTEGAVTAANNIVKRLNSLPDGDYRIYLLAACVAYVDVGQLRLAAGQPDGQKAQLEIVNKYKLEETEGHLWAWRVWEIARAARNRAAKELGLPVREYDN